MSEYAIDSGWLVEVVNEHTCGTAAGGYYGAHEPGCGLVPIAKVDDLLRALSAVARVTSLADTCEASAARDRADIAEHRDHWTLGQIDARERRAQNLDIVADGIRRALNVPTAANPPGEVAVDESSETRDERRGVDA